MIAGGTILVAGGAIYLLGDKNNFTRSDINERPSGKIPLQPDEREILYLASLAPSGHDTQPWFVKYMNRTIVLLVTIKANGFPP